MYHSKYSTNTRSINLKNPTEGGKSTTTIAYVLTKNKDTILHNTLQKRIGKTKYGNPYL